ncbi:MAG: hypothetical protein HQL93_07130 [Magnetococcales bacterium]|nr:hypothetical protein [Magnetococcales bacterium]
MRLPSLASLKWTPFFLVLLGLGAVGAAQGVASPTWLLVIPFVLLGLNLLAAIVMNAAFRAKPGLLVFHVALLGAVLLVGMGRLTYLKGWVELVKGDAFQGELTGVEKGLWHWGQLERVVFVNEGFVKEYGPNWWARRTRNSIRWMDEDGSWQQGEIGENATVTLHGYRIYTSSNHGFAPVFVWHPADQSSPIQGAIHFPSYPRYREQTNTWTIPGTDIAVVAMLLLDEPAINLVLGGVFPTVPKHQLRVTVQGETRDLVPGDRFPFASGGVLHYVELSAWMGYRIFYDWTRFWLLATFLVATLSLSWHFWRKFSMVYIKL